MEDKNKLTISKVDLETIIDTVGKALVGQAMKRFEMFDDKEKIKDEVKELVYENLRDLKKFVEVYNTGVNFISMPKDN